ncbi:MAG: hypothetical protein WBV45_01170 [Lutimonas sp.]
MKYSEHTANRTFIFKGWLLLLTLVTSLNLMAQVPDKGDELDMLLDELFFNEQQFVDDILDSFVPYNFIYVNLSFENNTYFTGRDPGVDQFNLVPQLSYYHSSGFNASVSGIYYEEYTPHWDFTSVYLGYFKNIGKNQSFGFEGGYTRYFYSDGWDVFTNALNLGIGLRNKKRTLGTKLSGTFLFGTDEAFQLISRTYGRILIARRENFVLKLRPQLNFIIAQQTIELERLDPDTNDPTGEFEYDDVFGLLNTQINLPIALATRSWDFEVGYDINFPNPVESEPSLDPTSYFHISIGYLIDLN